MFLIDVIFIKKNCIIIKLGFVGICMYMFILGELMVMKIKIEWILVIMENLEWLDWIF